MTLGRTPIDGSESFDEGKKASCVGSRVQSGMAAKEAGMRRANVAQSDGYAIPIRLPPIEEK